MEKIKKIIGGTLMIGSILVCASDYTEGSMLLFALEKILAMGALVLGVYLMGPDFNTFNEKENQE